MTPIVIVGEARGEQEARIESSFVGPSGIELLRMLNEAGTIQLQQSDRNKISEYYRRGDPNCIEEVWRNHAAIYRTNVFNQHPPANKLEYFCGPKVSGIDTYPALLPSKYVRREFEPELDRLGEEILSHDPNLIIGLGNTALWALCGRTGVSKLRGTTCVTTHCASGFKLLPCYHPAAVLRQWELRPTTIIDFIKAKREAEYPDIRRPACEIWIEPSLEDIERFINAYIVGTDGTVRCDILSIDVETSGSRITCFGFAPSAELALVVPFDDPRTKGGSYWPTLETEQQCWRLIRRVLEDERIKKLLQNALYDVAFTWRSYGIAIRGVLHDTMLLSHSQQPEALKGLGYLGSLWTDFGAWKTQRKFTATIGRDK